MSSAATGGGTEGAAGEGGQRVELCGCGRGFGAQLQGQPGGIGPGAVEASLRVGPCGGRVGDVGVERGEGGEGVVDGDGQPISVGLEHRGGGKPEGDCRFGVGLCGTPCRSSRVVVGHPCRAVGLQRHEPLLGGLPLLLGGGGGGQHVQRRRLH
jgi:hypothetical protein